LGGPSRSIKTPASIPIQVTEIRNPPPRKGEAHGGGRGYIIFEVKS